MNRFGTIHFLVVLCGFFSALMINIPASYPCPLPDSSAEIPASDDYEVILDNQNLPKPVLDLIHASRAKYLEGSNLIKTGDSEKAREAFNKAVDLLLQSNWDLTSTPVLNKFFQDLITRIRKDESQYLLAPYDTEEKVESAVMDELATLDLVPSQINPSLENNVAADLGETKYEIPITINSMVLKSLDFWLNSGRSYFIDGLLRSGQYRPIIEKIFREESIPLDLMYLAQVESLFKTNALSKAKAKGIWQFQAATARNYGLKITRDLDERSDPEKSTRAAAHYLKDLFVMFKDWNLVLAAYNCGEGKVQRLIDRTGIKDFWQLVNLRWKLPKETKNHVPLIHASVILARNPEKYGLPIELYPPLKYNEVSISKPIDLRAAAKILSTTIDELKRLNPSLRGLNTPANYPDFHLKVPIDSDPELHDKLASLPEAKMKAPVEFPTRYKIKKGETLTGIAARYHVSVKELQAANDLTSKSKLIAGAWLQVPSKISSSSAARSKKPVKNKSGSVKAKTNIAKKGSNKPVKSAKEQNRFGDKSESKQIAAR
jgi:membrane-bound lytic murein transglycosylase D